jgi:hypothetical protein
MKLISHRGNTVGSFESRENEQTYIDKAISEGYDVEVDLWVLKGILYLGHDNPQYDISESWLKERTDKLWVHCKNIEALHFLKKNNSQLNYFWHQTDDVTLTSKGFFWTYPGKELTTHSIAVMPEIEHFNNIGVAYGICSDYIEKYKI